MFLITTYSIWQFYHTESDIDLKLDSLLPKSFICFNGSTWKEWKIDVFISCKSSFCRRYSNICPNSFAHIEKQPHKKLRLISEFMMSKTGKQIITIHIFPNVLRGIGSQAMKQKNVTWTTFLLKNHTENVVGN